MGNTPSHHHNGHGGGHAQGQGQAGSSDNPNDLASPSPSTASHHRHHQQPHHHHRHPNLRLPMPSRPTHISPNSSNPTSPSGRSGSPRRRKSLELPDLNKLSFTPAALTPAAPVPTTHTHTSHHLAPSTAAAAAQGQGQGQGQPQPSTAPAGGTPSRKWHQALGGRTASPLAGANALGAMSRLDPSVSSAPPRSAPIAMPNTNVQSRQQQGQPSDENNPYFPSTAAQDAVASAKQPKSIPIPIPSTSAKQQPVDGRHAASEESRRPQGGLSPPPPTKVPTPQPREVGATASQVDADDGLVNVPVQWNGGGKTVYVTGNFADNWKGRIKLHRSTHDFNTILRLPPGQYRLKFIVDDSWRCSKQISTAVDDDGTLVNWIEVEAPKTEEEIKAEWAMDAKPAVKEEDDDESQWTTAIPPQLTLYQYIEELPSHFTPEEYSLFLKSVPYLSSVPAPPTLPRILDKVIVNNDTKRLWDSHDPAMAQQTGYNAPATLDDNSILAVPNHVVLNHLTASAIRNGTLGVGTTTRYRKKYITTMFFKPTLSDMPGADSISQSVQSQSVQ